MTGDQANGLYPWHARTARMRLAWLCARWTASCRREMEWFSTLRTFALGVVIAYMPAHLVRLNILKLATLAAGAKWISAPSVLEVPRKTIHRLSSRNMDVIGWRKANFLFVLKCAPPRPFSLGIAIRCPTSIGSALSHVALVPVLGAGVRPTKQKAVALGAKSRFRSGLSN